MNGTGVLKRRTLWLLFACSVAACADPGCPNGTVEQRGRCITTSDPIATAGQPPGEGSTESAATAAAGSSGRSGAATEAPGSIGGAAVAGTPSQRMNDSGVASHICGDGHVDPGETCDSQCPTQCFATSACVNVYLSGSAGRCDAVCISSPIGTCSGGDGCCPANCSPATDTDCSATCGNGSIDSNETCEPSSQVRPCLTSCDDGNPCTMDMLVGSAERCSSDCSHTPITAATGGDGCCPAGANPGADADCPTKCGDGAVSGAEKCDPASSSQPCPTTCDDGDPCTSDRLTGDVAACSAECMHGPTASPSCIAIPAGWTVGTLTSSGRCPSGYDTSVNLKSGPSVQCSTATCSCMQAAQGGSCVGSYTLTIRDQRDPNKILQTLTEQADQSDMCRRLTTTYGAVDTITAQPLQWRCDGGGDCEGCASAGVSMAEVAWTDELTFCSPLAVPARCGNGTICPPPAERLCVSTMGDRQCPAGFSERKTLYSDATATCQCAGCGVSISASCSAARYVFVTGATTGPCISLLADAAVASLPSAGGSTRVTAITDSTEFFGGVLGAPTPATCAAPEAKQVGGLTADGLRTICCQ